MSAATQTRDAVADRAPAQGAGRAGGARRAGPPELALAGALGNRAFAALADGDPALPPALAAGLASPGRPLPPGLRAAMERSLGASLAGVVVHDDPSAARSARALGAHAYAVGPHVVFGRGAYAPDTAVGRIVLGHELAHVVQQRDAGLPARFGLAPAGGALEAQAHVAGVSAALGVPGPALAPAGAVAVQRLDLKQKLLDKALDALLGPLPISRTQLELAVALGQGFGEEVIERIGKGEGMAVLERLYDMATDPKQIFQFQIGYVKGVFQGLWEQVKGFWDLLTLGPRIQFALIEWAVVTGPELLSNWDAVQPKLDAFKKSAEEAGDKIAKAFDEFKKDPVKAVESLMELAEAAKEKMRGLARQGGRKIAAELFDFLNSSASELGRKIGVVVGYVLVEVILAVATEGIATAAKSLASGVAKVIKAGRAAIEPILEAFRVARTAIKEAVVALKGLGAGARKAFEGVIGSFTKLADEAIELIELMATGLRPALAGGPAGMLPKAAKVAEEAAPIARKTPTTVAELTGKGAGAAPKTGPKGAPKTTPKAPPKAEPKKAPPTAEPKKAPPKAEPKKAPPTAEPKKAPPKAEPKKAPPTAEPKKAPPTAEPKKAPPKAEPKKAPPKAEPKKKAPGKNPFADLTPEEIDDALANLPKGPKGPGKQTPKPKKGKGAAGPKPPVAIEDSARRATRAAQKRAATEGKNWDAMTPAQKGTYIHTEFKRLVEAGVVPKGWKLSPEKHMRDLVDLPKEQLEMPVGKWLETHGGGKGDLSLPKKVLETKVGDLRPDLVIEGPGGVTGIADVVAKQNRQHLSKTILYTRIIGQSKPGKRLLQIIETYWAK